MLCDRFCTEFRTRSGQQFIPATDGPCSYISVVMKCCLAESALFIDCCDFETVNVLTRPLLGEPHIEGM
jgi:hypothetical protein